MPKTINIRNLDDEVYLALKRHAESAGIWVPELVRRHLRLLALEEPPNLTMEEWLEQASKRPVNPNITRESTLKALDEIRGPWPGDESDW